MKLFLLRHAIAEDRAVWKKSDAERPLTKEGVRKMEKNARGMRKGLNLTFDWILTSPFRRAYDSAQIVAREYKASKKLRLSKSLTPDGDIKGLIRHLALDFRSWESILLVGHEPYLSRLIALLVTGQADAELELKKGGLCALSADSLTPGRCARLEWILTPKQLRLF
jgi:phosphohistidine phosphatase